MAQGNAIIDLGGGANADNIIAVKQDMPSKNKFSFIHKDGHITVIDMNAFAIDFQVEGFAWKNGKPEDGILILQVKDHTTTPATVHDVEIDLNTYVKPITDSKVDKVTHAPLAGAVNRSGELVLSEENFSTAIMKKINALPIDAVGDVHYDALTEDITVTFVGASGKPDYVIGALADKVAKKTGWELSQNDLTDAIKAVYDKFDPTGVKELKFNPVNGEFSVSTYAAPSAFNTVFTIPVQVQADWKEVDSLKPSFIKNKDLIQNQLDINNRDIGINKSEITNTNTTVTALDVVVHTNTTDIATNTTRVGLLETDNATIRTEMADMDNEQKKLDVDIKHNAVGVATNVQDIANLKLINSGEDTKIADILVRLSANEAGDNIRDIDISTLEGEMVSTVANTAKNTADIAAVTTNVASHAGLIQNNTTELTLVQNQANVNETDIATNRTNIGANTNNIAMNKIATGKNELAVQKNITDIAQNASDINTLKSGIGMADNQIRDAVQRAVNSNVLNDADKLKLDNLSGNQKATDAAQDNALAKETTDRGVAIAAEKTDRVAKAAAAAAKATTDFVNVTGDTMTGQLVIPKRVSSDQAVRGDAYATNVLGGTVKMRMASGKLYITNNGSNA